MGYVLTIVYDDGGTQIHKCTTLTEVTNLTHSVMRSQFAPDLKASHISFHVNVDD